MKAYLRDRLQAENQQGINTQNLEYLLSIVDSLVDQYGAHSLQERMNNLFTQGRLSLGSVLQVIQKDSDNLPVESTNVPQVVLTDDDQNNYSVLVTEHSELKNQLEVVGDIGRVAIECVLRIVEDNIHTFYEKFSISSDQRIALKYLDSKFGGSTEMGNVAGASGFTMPADINREVIPRNREPATLKAEDKTSTQRSELKSEIEEANKLIEQTNEGLYRSVLEAHLTELRRELGDLDISETDNHDYRGTPLGAQSPTSKPLAGSKDGSSGAIPKRRYEQ